MESQGGKQRLQERWVWCCVSHLLFLQTDTVGRKCHSTVTYHSTVTWISTEAKAGLPGKL